MAPGDYVSRGTNSQGNDYRVQEYNPAAENPNSYHYSNQDNSYYYKNSDGSTYHNSPTTGSVYTDSAGNSTHTPAQNAGTGK